MEVCLDNFNSLLIDNRPFRSASGSVTIGTVIVRRSQ